jgi:hypothetical protein
MEGRAGAMLCIYWGEVSDDSDGPLEWCRPVPQDQAETLAAGIAELSLRAEPAHQEAFVSIGSDGQTNSAQWQLVSEALHAWGEVRGVRPSDLAMRITYLPTPPRTEDSSPDCDFAVPFQ